MSSKLRDALLNAQDIQSEIVDVPQWGVKIEVRGMTGKARANFLRSVTVKDGQTDMERFYPQLIIGTAHDPETGEPVFTLADREALNEKSGAALEVLAQAAMRLSGLISADIVETEASLDETPKSAST